MRGNIILETLAEKDQNYVNGSCDFCGNRFASRILILRPQKDMVERYKTFEYRFCDDCFIPLRNLVLESSHQRPKNSSLMR